MTMKRAPQLDGDVFEPGSAGYEEACTLFNAAIERAPALVVRCASTADVAAAIAHARERGLPLAVRGGGHSAAGRSLCDGGIVLDVRGLNEIDIDPDARTARVGGGALTGQLDRAAQEHGLATTTGRVSTTGISGFTLGGGSGWLERRFGFAVDNVLAAELVTADGELVSADEQNNPDLFWALRGGGGNFGVVTSLTFRLHPVGPVTAGLLLYDGERGPEVLRHLRDVMEMAPEELAVAFAYFHGPAEDGVPEELHGRLTASVWICHSGSLESAESDLRPLREFGPPAADMVEPTTFADWNSSMDDPAGYRNYFTAQHVDELTDPAIDLVHERSLGLPAGPGWTLLVCWGGAVTRPPSSTPITHREARWVVHPGAFWSDPADDRAAIEWARGFRDDLREFSSGGVWLNWIGDEGEGRVKEAFGSENHARLRSIKAAYDPENLFAGNHNVEPS
jgi:FAD/FMN-containing dehydrogenase